MATTHDDVDVDQQFVKDLRAKPDISRPRWNQSDFYGRARHFFAVVNPLNVLASDRELEQSRDTVLNYRYANRTKL